ncbi:unnamed protein product [Moneuplotes crassus]|uniref:C2 NT-type domain-containing protein n=2 Tax=Euplotes crassus TaxID=5936 RepID=A0AAD2D9Q5_EUPCR|nr:unnamed protein product [Moneuplotes crassus]
MEDLAHMTPTKNEELEESKQFDSEQTTDEKQREEASQDEINPNSHKYFFSFKILKLEITPKSAAKASICLKVGNKEIFTVNKPKIDPKRSGKGGKCMALFRDEKLKLMSKLKVDENTLKPKKIYFKIILHHLKKGQSHIVGHTTLNLSDHVTPPTDPRNSPFEKLLELKFQKCIDKFAKLYVYIHSMRVTDFDPNLNYDLDDNMSGYNSLNSGGNGLQSEYNYPDSMCGSANGDYITNRLTQKARCRSPIQFQNKQMSAMNGSIKQKGNATGRLGSTDRKTGAVKVSIDISQNGVANTLGVSNAMKKFKKVKNIQKGAHSQSFRDNIAPCASKESLQSDDPKGFFSNNDSGIRLNSSLQNENEDKIRKLEAKLEEIMKEKNEQLQQRQKIENELNLVKKVNKGLQEQNSGLEQRLNHYMDSISSQEDSEKINIWKQELKIKKEELANLQAQSKAEITTLQEELQKERRLCQEMTSKVEILELKSPNSSMDMKQSENTRSQTIGGFNDRSSEKRNTFSLANNSNLELMKARKDIDRTRNMLEKLEEEQTELKKELEVKKAAISRQEKEITELEETSRSTIIDLKETIRKKEGQMEVMSKDFEFNLSKHKNEISKAKMETKHREFEIEELQDKITALEMRLKKPGEETSDDQSDKPKEFNYAAHWVIEENLRDRIRELKKETQTHIDKFNNSEKERTDLEAKLIEVKTRLANSELDRALLGLGSDNEEGEE